MRIVFIVPWYLEMVSVTKMNHSLEVRRCLLPFFFIFSWKTNFEASLRHHNSCCFEFRLLLHLFFLIIYSVFLCINYYILGNDINYIQMQFCYITLFALMLLKTKTTPELESLPDIYNPSYVARGQWGKTDWKFKPKRKSAGEALETDGNKNSLSFKYARKTIRKTLNNC